MRTTVIGFLVLASCVTGFWISSEHQSNCNFDEGDEKASASGQAKYGYRGAREHFETMTRNAVTGKVEASDFQEAFAAVRNMAGLRQPDYKFVEEGPNNVGGRTRAVVVDPTNDNIVYAGAVGGGLFKSTDRATTWTRVQAFDDFMMNESAQSPIGVSSIDITGSGRLYVAFGAKTFEGREVQVNTAGIQRGYSVLFSDDGGDSFQSLPGTEGWNVNVVCADVLDADKIWIGGIGSKLRLHSYDQGTDALVMHPDVPATVIDIDFSGDGKLMIVGGLKSGVTTYRSTDGGNTFEAYPTGQVLPRSGLKRMVYDVSQVKNKNGAYSVVAVGVNNTEVLQGAYLSEDAGLTWQQIAQGKSKSLYPFSHEKEGIPGQGLFDATVSFFPDDPTKFIVGGTQLFGYYNGNWSKIAEYHEAFGLSDQTWVHADKHRLTWDSQGRLYIGSDGGVTVSDDGAKSYIAHNRGYNVTQFYDIAVNRYGDIAGGAQDNGTNFKSGDAADFSAFEFRSIGGGDGNTVYLSDIDRKAVIASSQYSNIRRINGGTAGWDKPSSIFSAVVNEAVNKTVGGKDKSYGEEGIGQPFVSIFGVFENAYDKNTKDRITFLAEKEYKAGDSVSYVSRTLGVLFDTVTPIDLYYSDTLTSDGFVDKDIELDSTFKDVNGNDSVGQIIRTFNWHYALHPKTKDTIWMERKEVIFNATLDTVYFMDYAQSICAVDLGTAGIWISRDMMRFAETNQQWWRIVEGKQGVTCFEFSKDGSHLWYGTENGGLFRVSNLNNMYGDWPSDKDSSKYASANLKRFGLSIKSLGDKITGSNAIGGIDIDPRNPDHVLVTCGGFGGGDKIWESNNATGSASFKSIQGNLMDMPVFDGIIDFRDDQKMVVGTYYGAYATDDGGDQWYAMNNEIGHVPVYEVVQQWREWGEQGSIVNSGKIYLGTHGRGIWSSSEYVGIEDQAADQNGFDELTIYPNPANVETWVSPKLSNGGDINIQIFNLNGALLRTQQYQNLNSGKVQLRLDVQNLPVGTYIVKLMSERSTETGRFVKMR